MIRVKIAIIIFVAALCLPRGVFASTALVSDYLYEYGVDRYKAGDISDAIHELKKALIANPANDKACRFLRKIAPLVTEVSLYPKIACRFKRIKFNFKANLAYNQDNLTYSWDFGDGSSTQGSKVTHRYNKAGEYIVTLTVDDSSGLACLTLKSSLKVVVHEKPKAIIKIREKY